MELAFVPLLRRQRELHDLPRGPARFAAYLRLLNRDRPAEILAPLLIVNPMAREPVAIVLDTLLALGADRAAEQAVSEAARTLIATPGGPYRVSLVVADDAGGGWTNRYAWEYARRFERPPAAQRDWLTAVLWSSDAPTARAADQAVRMTIHRGAYCQRNGVARTLRERLRQEGEVMRAADWAGPTLGDEELAFTRETVRPHLEATDLPTAIVHLFGDPAANSLGYRPAGLSPWAGLALAWHDARTGCQENLLPNL